MLDFTRALKSSGLRMYNAAASPFRGSAGFGYLNNCGKNISKTLTKPKKKTRNYLDLDLKICVP